MPATLVLPVSASANGTFHSGAAASGDAPAGDFASMLFSELSRMASDALPSDAAPVDPSTAELPADLSNPGLALGDQRRSDRAMLVSNPLGKLDGHIGQIKADAGRPEQTGLDLARLKFPEQSKLPELPANAGLATGLENTGDLAENPSTPLAAWLGDTKAASGDKKSLGNHADEAPDEDSAPLTALVSPPVELPPKAVEHAAGENAAIKGDGRPATPPGLEMLAVRATSQESPANLAAAPQAQGEANFSSALQNAQAQMQANPAAKAADVQGNPDIKTPVGASNWGHDFSQRVVWMARNDQQSAQLQINPPQLGPVHISLNLSGDQATAVFASPHAEVRQAIEEALPRLREMLAGTGIALGDANVGSQLPQPRDNPGQFVAESRRHNENAILSADSPSAQTAAAPVLLRGRGMVDLFA